MAYVYKHIRKDTNEVFYIGIGKYLKRAYSKKGRNSHWHNIVNKTDYIVDIIEFNLTWDEACEKEKFWIKKYGRFDLNEGLLVNKTEGGEGVKGHSEELKQRLREYRLGKPIPEEQRKKISKSLRGKTITESHKEHLSESLKNRKLTEEHKNNISSSMKGKFSGEKNPNYGKKPSKDTIKKLELRAKNRKKINCPICGKLVDITATRFHFNNCKFR